MRLIEDGETKLRRLNSADMEERENGIGPATSSLMNSFWLEESAWMVKGTGL
jgi:hypothetical protein